MIRTVPRRWLVVLAVSYCLGITGCFHQHNPPEVLITPLGDYTHAARGPGCRMPVFDGQPTRSYKQVAIVEGWGDADQSQQVVDAARSRACETGADALVVISAKSQKVVKNLYDVTPNEVQQSVSSAGASSQSGSYIHQKEYKPMPGEAGYNGYYFDAAAIVYNNDAGPGIASGAPHP